MKRTSYFSRVARSTVVTAVRVRPPRHVFARHESAWGEVTPPATASTAASPDHSVTATPLPGRLITPRSASPVIAAARPGVSSQVEAAAEVPLSPPGVADVPPAVANELRPPSARGLRASLFNSPPRPVDEPGPAAGREASTAQAAAVFASPAVRAPRPPRAEPSAGATETIVMQPAPAACMQPEGERQPAVIPLPRAEGAWQERHNTSVSGAEAPPRVSAAAAAVPSLQPYPAPSPVDRQTWAAQSAAHDTVHIESLEIVLTAPPPPMPQQRQRARAVKTPVTRLARAYVSAVGWRQS